VPDTAARLLRFLSLLQTRREWPGAELAARLEVSPRTVRRDVERLRDLGYPVHAARGASGYRLGAGAALPPLLLDDDETVAVAVGLRAAACGVIGGIAEPALRAIAKIEQVLPSRLRHRVETLNVVTVPAPASVPRIDASLLTTIATACREHEQLRFGYRDRSDVDSRRVVEPHSVICWGRRWYLVAWDVDRRDWRTFRVDRLQLRSPSGPRFVPREPPEGDVSRFLAQQLSSAAWPYRARVLLRDSLEDVAARMWPGFGVLTPVDEHTCLLEVGADSLVALTQIISLVDVEFEVIEPLELIETFARLAARYWRAGGGADGAKHRAWSD
jgi:predicted DNA-binding transcriptional regulator YafY